MTAFWIILIIVCLYLATSDNKKLKYSTVEGNQIIFTAKFSRGGNLFYPERLIFDKDNVTLKSNDGANSLYTTTRIQIIPIRKITGYKISRYLVGCNITIIGEGYQNLLAIGYTGIDADKIENLLKESLRNK